MPADVGSMIPSRSFSSVSNQKFFGIDIPEAEVVVFKIVNSEVRWVNKLTRFT